MISGRRSTQDRSLTIMSLISGNGTGGADRLALDISIGLKARGHRVIWGSTSDCCLVDEAVAAGLEIYKVDFGGCARASWLSDFVHFCRKEQVDVVNGHDSPIRHMISLAKIRGLRAKVVSTRHCILKTVPYLGGFAHNFLADMHIAVSKAVKDSLTRSGVLPSRAATIYGGVDTVRFENVRPSEVERVERLYKRPGAFAIGMVARLQHGKDFCPDKPTLKGHEVAFRALAQFNRDFTLLLLGPQNEEERENLRRIAKYHGFNPAKITFCGFQKEIAPFYKIFDLSILPSPNEGLGLAVIEAMAAGVPCIGADGGGLKEVINDGEDGFLVKPGDSRDLLEKIRIVCDDMAIRCKFISNGREKVRERFNGERMVRETEEIYCRLARQVVSVPHTTGK